MKKILAGCAKKHVENLHERRNFADKINAYGTIIKCEIYEFVMKGFEVRNV